MPVPMSKRDARILQLRLDGDSAADVTPRKPRKQREAREQRLLFAWRERLLPKYPRLRWLFATWNGVPLHPSTVKTLAGLGLKGSKGIFDLWLPVRRCKENGSVVCGLAIDLKAWHNARPSKEQREWKNHLIENGWEAFFETSAHGAWQRIAAHLDIEGDDYEARDLAQQEKWIQLEEG